MGVYNSFFILPFLSPFLIHLLTHYISPSLIQAAFIEFRESVLPRLQVSFCFFFVIFPSAHFLSYPPPVACYFLSLFSGLSFSLLSCSIRIISFFSSLTLILPLSLSNYALNPSPPPHLPSPSPSQSESPGLRRSQLLEAVYKEWQRSPRNPANQA